jgi:precorrin-6Y C5,15-methyltransferase (decarboxylating)
LKQVQVIGLGLGTQDVTPRMAEAIQKAEVLAGGKRLLNWLPKHTGVRLELSGAFNAWLDEVADLARDKKVAVLASGDPGFFGVAKAVVERLGSDNVSVLPNVSAMQAACAKLNLPWGNAGHVSLHAEDGRAWQKLWQAMAQSDLVSVYTRPGCGPAEIAAMLKQRGLNTWRMHVLENLGADNEQVSCYQPNEAADKEFSSLSLVLLERTVQSDQLCLGTSEDQYQHEKNLITKAEVRAVALAKLELGPGMTLWDIGAGSGSLGIEASLLIPGGRVVSLENHPERVGMIQANREKYSVGMLEIVQGKAPEALADLSAPHRVFIGGGGRNLAEIIRVAVNRLQTNGIIVASAVLLESMRSAGVAMEDAGLIVDQTLIQVSRSSEVAGQTMMKALNPVWLIRGRKQAGDCPNG